jgi:hypothetical protein
MNSSMLGGGFQLTVSYIWDAYEWEIEQRMLTPQEGGYLLDWNNSGIVNLETTALRPDTSANGMTSDTLTIGKHDDGWKRLNSTGVFSRLDDWNEIYFITLRCRLPKGLTGGGDYTGGRDIAVTGIGYTRPN